MAIGTAAETARATTVHDVLVTSSLRRLVIMSALGILFLVTGHEPFGAAAAHVAALGLAISMVIRPPRADRLRARRERKPWRVVVPRWICSGRDRQTHAPILRYHRHERG
ncbi:hypothetical protein [Allokutzneria oryzae]|uniref:Uncharacterized protein n=1 Tax=Allokutzneria oryzae TaxID=1378989 RepID=A0ABV6A671_9PSEU